MSKRKTYEIFLSGEDRIHVDLEFEKARGTRLRIHRFAITYSARIGRRWREVVRYDNFHGYLHRQKFWRSAEPERVPAMERMPIDAVLEACRKDLRAHWRRYRTLMEPRMEEE